MVFPAVMYGCESWAIKKAVHQRIEAFELWCWRRLFTVPWTAWRSSQSILKKSVLNTHWKDWCRSWNSSSLDTWCKDLTHWKTPYCWKDWRQKEKVTTGWEDWMASWTPWTWLWANSVSSPWGESGLLQSMESQKIGHNWVPEITYFYDYLPVICVYYGKEIL